jgi:hypothetical protein
MTQEGSQPAAQWLSSNPAGPIGNMLMNISHAAASLASYVFKEHHGIAHAIRA